MSVEVTSAGIKSGLGGRFASGENEGIVIDEEADTDTVDDGFVAIGVGVCTGVGLGNAKNAAASKASTKMNNNRGFLSMF